MESPNRFRVLPNEGLRLSEVTASQDDLSGQIMHPGFPLVAVQIRFLTSGRLFEGLHLIPGFLQTTLVEEALQEIDAVLGDHPRIQAAAHGIPFHELAGRLLPLQLKAQARSARCAISSRKICDVR